MQTSHFRTRTAEISRATEGYIKIKMLPDSIVDAEDALDNMLVIKNLSSGEKTLKLIDVRGNWSMTAEARKVSIKNFSPETTIARAYVVDSLLTKVMLSFLKSFAEKKVPEEFFNHEEEAVEWLLTYQK